MLKENTEAFYEALRKDFKTASSEYVFESPGTTRHDRVYEVATEGLDDAIEHAHPQIPGRFGTYDQSPPGAVCPTLVIGPFNASLTL